MNKGIRLLTGGLTCVLLLGGCSMDSKTQVVVPRKQKENTLFIKESEGNLSEQIQAPVRYQRDMYINGVHLLANARVIVPNVEGIKLKKIRSRRFTDADMVNIQENLFNGEKIHIFQTYNSEFSVGEQEMVQQQIKEKQETEEEAPKKQNEVSQASNTDVSIEGDYNGVAEGSMKPPKTYREARVLLKEVLGKKKTFFYNREEDLVCLNNLFQEAADQTDDWAEAQKLRDLANLCGELLYKGQDSTAWEPQDFTMLSKEIDVAGAVMDKNAVYAFYFTNGVTVTENTEISVGRNSIDILTLPDAANLNPLKTDTGESIVESYEENLAELDLQKKSNELIKSLGFENVELANVEERKLVYWSGEIPIKTSALHFSYMQMVDDIPITAVPGNGNYWSNEEGTIRWPDETLYTTYGKEGLVDFYWGYPAQVEDWHDEYAFLLPFSEIQNIFEELLINKNEALLNTEDSGALTISEVRLGYVKVTDKDLLQEESNVSTADNKTVYTNVLVPAWDFIGTAEGAVADMYGVVNGTRISYMTINATDGSIIQR